MGNDLIERLRRIEGDVTKSHRNPDGSEAADEIETLRARIAQIQRKAYSNGNRTFDDCIRDLGEIDDLARAALTEASDDG